MGDNLTPSGRAHPGTGANRAPTLGDPTRPRGIPASTSIAPRKPARTTEPARWINLPRRCTCRCRGSCCGRRCCRAALARARAGADGGSAGSARDRDRQPEPGGVEAGPRRDRVDRPLRPAGGLSSHAERPSGRRLPGGARSEDRYRAPARGAQLAPSWARLDALARALLDEPEIRERVRLRTAPSALAAVRTVHWVGPGDPFDGPAPPSSTWGWPARPGGDRRVAALARGANAGLRRRGCRCRRRRRRAPVAPGR